MRTTDATFKACLKSRRIIINRRTISLLGNPTHLGFWYDDNDGDLFVTPASADELDAFEIPKFYWNDPRQPCGIQRIAFLIALQKKLGWEDGCSYAVVGTLVGNARTPKIVFSLLDGVRLK
jgi:hypothetical protein